jgi:hypothetical protein
MEFPRCVDGVIDDAAETILNHQPRPDVVAFQEVFFPRSFDRLVERLSPEYELVVAPEVGQKPGAPWPTWPLVITIPLAFVWKLRQGGLATFVRRGPWTVRDSLFWQYCDEASPARLLEGDGYADKGAHELVLSHATSGTEIAVLNTHVQAEYRKNPQRHAKIRQAQLAQL